MKNILKEMFLGILSLLFIGFFVVGCFGIMLVVMKVVMLHLGL